MTEASRQAESDAAPKLRARGRARRAAILKTAAELFLAQGYERTSLAQIIERAGGSRSSVYAQFGDKAGLFRTVVIDLCEEMFAPTAEGGMPEGAPPEDALTAIAHGFLDLLWGEDVRALSRIVYTEGERNPEIADVFFETGYEQGYAMVAGYLRRIEPALTESDALDLSRMFLTMLPGDAYDRLLAGTSTQRSQDYLDRQVALSVEWLMWKLEAAEPGP